MEGVAGGILSGIKPRCLVLCYHRICEPGNDPQRLSVSPKNFQEQLRVIKKHYSSVRLQDLAKQIKKGEVPHKAVILTFDDGYADNLINAKKILEENSIPATVFVSTGYIDSGGFWWDDLVDILLSGRQLPKSLELEINGTKHRWDIDDGWKGKSPGSWNVESEKDPSQRHIAYRQLHLLVRQLKPEARDEVLKELREWAASDKASSRANRCLTVDELRRMAGGQVEIGSHTTSHPVLSTLTLEEQKRELVGSKRFLDETLGQETFSLSYPFGGPGDVSEDTLRLSREAGYGIACANVRGVVTGKTDTYWVPRFIVRDWDAMEFQRRLRGWFSGR